MAPIVADIIAKELGYDSEWITVEVQKFNELAQGYLLN